MRAAAAGSWSSRESKGMKHKRAHTRQQQRRRQRKVAEKEAAAAEKAAKAVAEAAAAEAAAANAHGHESRAGTCPSSVTKIIWLKSLDSRSNLKSHSRHCEPD